MIGVGACVIVVSQCAECGVVRCRARGRSWCRRTGWRSVRHRCKWSSCVGQVNVVAVVLSRMESPRRGGEMAGVLLWRFARGNGGEAVVVDRRNRERGVGCVVLWGLSLVFVVGACVIVVFQFAECGVVRRRTRGRAWCRCTGWRLARRRCRWSSSVGQVIIVTVVQSRVELPCRCGEVAGVLSWCCARRGK